MKSARRIYLYVVSFASLQALSWALIFLLRNLFDNGQEADLAWVLATIIISTPFFAGHWLWARRLIQADPREREAPFRAFFLYALLASFLGASMTQTYRLLRAVLEQVTGVVSRLPLTDPMLDAVLALAVLIPFFLYFARVPVRDRGGNSDRSQVAFWRRLYQWGFLAAGLGLIAIALIALLIPPLKFELWETLELTAEIPRLLVGLVVWALFWSRLGANFRQNFAGEQRDLLRKVVLTLFMFVGLVSFVTFTSLLWDQILQRLLGLEVTGEIADALAPIIVGGLVWGYHAYALRRDDQLVVEPGQPVRRAYSYIVAGVGFAATLVGVAGLLSMVILFLIDGEMIDRRVLAGFLSVLSAGLPVWLIPLWRIQGRINGPAEAALAESQSLARRIYLYWFLLVAALTILPSAVYILYRGLLLLLGAAANETISDLALALAYGLIGVVLWIYHRRLLRIDGNRQQRDRAAKVKDLRVLLLDGGIDDLAQQLTAALREALPQLNLTYSDEEAELPDIIVGPAQTVLERYGDTDWGEAEPHKVVLPLSRSAVTWSSVETTNRAELITDAVRVVESVALSEEVAPRRWGLGRIIGTGIGGLFALLLVIWLLFFLSNILYF